MSQPPSEPLEVAKRKISVAGALVQSVLAESMDVHGHGRKTIHFLGSQEQGLPETQVFKSKLTMAQIHDMSQVMHILMTIYEIFKNMCQL